jgi:hypothetical protein
MPTATDHTSTVHRCSRRSRCTHPTAAEMAALREYLTTSGATCVENRSGTQTWCQGAYSAGWAVERWVGPLGHDLTFRFAGPNPVGPQRNGWSVDGRPVGQPFEVPRVGHGGPRLPFARVRPALEVHEGGSRQPQAARDRIAVCCEGNNPLHSASCASGSPTAPAAYTWRAARSTSWAIPRPARRPRQPPKSLPPSRRLGQGHGPLPWLRSTRPKPSQADRRLGASCPNPEFNRCKTVGLGPNPSSGAQLCSRIQAGRKSRKCSFEENSPVG